MFSFTIDYVLVLIGTLLMPLFLTPLVRFLAFRVGAVDNPNARRVNKVPMPTSGGLAIFMSFLVASLGLIPIASKGAMFFGQTYFSYILPVVIGATVITLTGFLDDLYELSPKLKMFGILIGAMIVWAFTDFKFDSFKIPFGGPLLVFGPFLTLFLTVLWIVSITNAINLIDGLDGLVSGVSIISLVTMAIVSYFFLPQKDFFLTLTILVLIAAIAGFFPYNYHPAMIYLGDTGALFIGFMIGVLSLQGLKNSTAVAVVTPVIILGVPIMDTIVAIIRRSLSGQKFYEPDKMHLHHRLLSMGFTHRGAVLVVYGITMLFSLISLLLNVSSRIGGVLLMLGLLFGLEVFIEGLEIWGEKRTPLFNLLKFIGNSDYRQAMLLKWKEKKDLKH
ncbi:TPA: undecaprenyl/decaprenyl-phosphate alpha-N-acetylglucosaminyl 1-phosphate transferase [Streptococcus pyogenes]|uniref:Undecaprenyl-phosphate N-acetylglucosaminyl 1-phosphate transferase n=1 Tax=Streptococcus pyogenes serotype M49 (strain NZ131) TaxID=471876 RepID=A0A0H3BYN4_STRPZ|nr:MraY family glycosyltransferase [Streptococcus pyogenes]ACI60581.1 Undecaprenyl-phosphate N-acetylglucosaminyl 1- phosphate transferase [Streptococcus pyogenes NZ131]MCX2501074.1 MraY family glycosyltransferase [Streptococcus pyogenes]MCX2509213.1 MraY family glycosyltransferase [Streptococcus pyogenes]NBA04022.1 undecaprenyl/decaprenyl-phosphate alpha-N-acetylglucosaminyl 1-phosphate transferase [Streptococcus pyogenes]QXF26137.1 putative undecaprenyl-phosphate N-acetylglucosaminyl 1-phosp